MPGSRSLAVRMALVAVLTPVVALGLFVAVLALMPGRYLLGLIVALSVSAVATAAKRGNQKPPPGRTLSPQDDPDLFAMLDRLCALADISRPEVVLSEEHQPNSWVVHFPRQRPRLYLTRGLRDLLTNEELQAVLGHELAHIANRDAVVMTVIGWPTAVMLRLNGVGGLDSLLVMGIGAISHICLTVLSRYREFAADAGSCAIAGRPSALASALLKVSDALEQIPRKDLRAAAALNAFNLVGVPSRSRLSRRLPFVARVSATHPRLQARLGALEALERAQQRRRGTLRT